MPYQIDQSGKIEQTSKNTVIALSNSVQRSIIIKSKEKRQLQIIFRNAGKPKVFSIQVFAALTYLLIEKARIEIGLLYIDREYQGHEALIKSYIIQLIIKRNKVKLNSDNIRFTQVGKTSRAHIFGYKCYKKGKADFKATKDDILSCILSYGS